MKRSKKAIGARLQRASVAIESALTDPELGPPLAAFGYDSARLTQGKAILESATAAVVKQATTAGGWQVATDLLAKAELEARTAHQALAQVIRAAYGPRNRPSLARFGLVGPTPNGQGQFITLAKTLFTNASSQPELTAEVVRYGYTPEKLASEYTKVQAMEKALQAREVAKGAAQQATMDQLVALSDLDRWMGAFVRVARVAFHGQPQQLEKLSVVVHNAKTPAQRQAPAKAAETRRARTAALTVVPPAAPTKETDTQKVA